MTIRSAALSMLFCLASVLPATAQDQPLNFLKAVGNPKNEVTSLFDSTCSPRARYVSASNRRKRLKISPGDTFEMTSFVLNCSGKDLTRRYHIRYYLVPIAQAPINDAELRRFMVRAPRRSGSFAIGTKIEKNTCLVDCDNHLETKRKMRWDSALTGVFRLVICPANTGGISKGIAFTEGNAGRQCSLGSVFEVEAPKPRVDVSAESLIVTQEYWEKVPLAGTVLNAGARSLGSVGNSAQFKVRSYPIVPVGFEREAAVRLVSRQSFLQGSSFSAGSTRTVEARLNAQNRLTPRLLSNGKVPDAMMFDFSMGLSLTGDEDPRNNSATQSVRAIPNAGCEIALFWRKSTRSRVLEADKAPGQIAFRLANTGKIGCPGMSYVLMRRLLDDDGAVVKPWAAVSGVLSSPGVPRMTVRGLSVMDRTPITDRGLVQYTLQVSGPHPDDRHFNHQGEDAAITMRVR